MQEYPIHHKNTTKVARTQHFAAIYNDQISLSSFYPKAELTIESTDFFDETVNIYAHCSLDYGICPYCGAKSNKVHSHYTRHIWDLPILGKKNVLHLRMRKFFCMNPECRYHTFAEQPGIEIFRYRRRTRRCEIVQSRHALKHSSNVASKLLSCQGICLSGSTILRDLHRLKPSLHADVKRIGIDDWAQKKGRVYGSIIIDLDRSTVIDLLDDREQESFGAWLEKHRSVELASRDRSTDYSAAIASSGREITEVADKFHLIKNIQDRFIKVLSEHYNDYRTMVRNDEHPPESPKDNQWESRKEESSSATIKEKIDSRQTMFNEVKELQAKGFRPTTISRKLGISRVTATKYCSMEFLPERACKHRNGYERFDKYVEEEAWKGKALSSIYEEIKDLGFKGSRTPFYDHYRYLSDGHRGYRPKGYKPKRKEKVLDKRSALVPIKTMASVVFNHMGGKELNDEDKRLMNILKQASWFNQMYEATDSFYNIIKGSDSIELIRWMKKYWKTNIAHLKTFIKGVKLDYTAVKNTIVYNVTNGITEGFVNKLKVVKRIMYGKASIGLLKNKLTMEHVLFN